jgi:signal transduction histidine kinase
MKINPRLAGFLEHSDVQIISVAVLYVLTAYLGFSLNFINSDALAIWPPNGVAFALMLLLGYRIWPGILIGSLITYSIGFIRLGIAMNVGSVTAITVISVGNVAEILIGFMLYNYLIKEGTPYDKTANTFKFLFLSLAMGMVGAVLHTAALFLNGIIFETAIRYNLITVYLADITGLLLFTNLILSWVKGKTHWEFNIKNVFETIMFTGAVVLLLYFINSDTLSVAVERAFPFLIIPFLLWVAFRSSIQVATTFVLAISLFSVFITMNAAGPFVLESAQNSIFLLQIFMSVIAITTMILSASVFERTEVKKKIEHFNETLERAVVSRTKALDDEIRIRKRTENKIRVSNKELRKINGELDSFVYKVSHDLRAPISSILGLVNIARIDKSQDNMLECIKQIERSAKTQDEFIKDIIDLTKNSRLAPEKQRIDFKKLINETFDTLKYSVQAPDYKPAIEIKQKKVFYSDNNRLKVIFNNLLSNSIKYGHPTDARIDIKVDVYNGHANIVVEDNGRGIDKKYKGDVFKMFYRATDQNAGSGLGLYIVKETVERLHGEVKLESEINKGTTISLKIPNLATEKNGRKRKPVAS